MDGEGTLKEGRIRLGGRVLWERDAGANDSDKSFGVPAGKRRHLLDIYYEYIATAAVGIRTVCILITDGANTLYRSETLALDPSDTGAFRASPEFSNYVATTPAYNFVGVAVTHCATTFLPDMYLDPGSIIRVYDAAAIAAATDDMVVVLHYIDYDTG